MLCALLPNGVAHAGWFGEHKRIGDEAFLWLLAQPGVRELLVGDLRMQPFASGSAAGLAVPYRRAEWSALYRGQIAVTTRDTLGLTYGDLTGLSGDHGVDPQQLADGLVGMSVPDPTSGRQEIALPLMNYGPVAFASLEQEMFCDLTAHRAALEGGDQGAGLFEIPYLLVAKEDEGHFYRAGKSLREQLDNVDVELAGLLHDYFFDTLASTRGRLVDRLFRANAISKYAAFHMVAMEFATQAGRFIEADAAADRAYGRRQFVRALFYNAFADHYLQDCFASGHLVVSRSQWHALDDNGLHDYYSRVGITVKNAEGDTWTSYGDRFYDTATYRRAIAANKASLSELWNGFTAAREVERTLRADPNVDVDRPISPLERIFRSHKREHVNNFSEFLATSFELYRLAPTPFTPKELSAFTFANSRNGTVLSAGLLRGFEGAAGTPNLLWRGRLMFGNAFSKPSERGCCADVESYMWFGLALSASGAINSGRRWVDFTAGVETVLNDAFPIELNAGVRRRDGVGGALWSPAVGYEFKPLSWSFAPSLKVVAMYATHSLPIYGVQVELRYY